MCSNKFVSMLLCLRPCLNLLNQYDIIKEIIKMPTTATAAQAASIAGNTTPINSSSLALISCNLVSILSPITSDIPCPIEVRLLVNIPEFLGSDGKLLSDNRVLFSLCAIAFCWFVIET